VLLVMVSAVFLIQQLGASAAAAPAPTDAKVTAPAGFDPFGGMARLMLRFSGLIDKMGGTPAGAEMARTDITEMIEGQVMSDVDALRAAIVNGFIAGPERAGAGLDNLATKLAIDPQPFEGATEDIEQVRRAFEQGKSALSDAEQQRLTDRHGYFAKVLFAATDPNASAERDAITAGGGMLIALTILFILFLFAVFIAAVVCFGIALSMLTKGRIVSRFRPPEPGGSIFLETTAALVAGFLGLQIVISVIELLAAGASGSGATPAGTSGGASGGTSAQGVGMLLLSFVLQWSLLLVIFYPRLRGVPWPEARRRMGLHSGEGVMKEVGAGIFAYFATLPIVVGAIIITLIGVLVRGFFQGGGGAGGAGGAGGGGPVAPENPVIDIVASGNWLTLVMLYLLATIWAPLVEETIFRGCFYRHLRARMGIIICAILSAVVFGVMHGYEFMLLGPVIALGFNFALMREWRDSLIGPIAAHALHNGTVLIIAIVAMNQMAVPGV
jgi:membrane protease YdiL (CAAX protease family)